MPAEPCASTSHRDRPFGWSSRRARFISSRRGCPGRFLRFRHAHEKPSGVRPRGRVPGRGGSNTIPGITVMRAIKDRHRSGVVNHAHQGKDAAPAPGEMHRRGLKALLAAYRVRWPQESATVELFDAFVDAHLDCFHRSCRVGHITGSAWLVDTAGSRPPNSTSGCERRSRSPIPERRQHCRSGRDHQEPHRSNA